jgi:hypothetical protein
MITHTKKEDIMRKVLFIVLLLAFTALGGALGASTCTCGDLCGGSSITCTGACYGCCGMCLLGCGSRPQLCEGPGGPQDTTGAEPFKGMTSLSGGEVSLSAFLASLQVAPARADVIPARAMRAKK